MTFPKKPSLDYPMWVSPEHLSRSFPGPQSRDRLLAKFKIIFTACSLMSFEPGDVFLSPEHPGPNCYHPLSVREPVRARYIADLNR